VNNDELQRNIGCQFITRESETHWTERHRK